MTEIRRISIVLPVFNEEGNLTHLLAELELVRERLRPLEVELIFVDDGSVDGSRDLLRTAAAERPGVTAIFFRRNEGQTAAIRCGIRRATGDVIVLMDTDLQNDPADIPHLLEKIREGYSCVSGWRKDRQDPYWSRILPSNIANAIIAWLTGVPLHDYGCSLKAYQREILQGIHLYGEMHRFIPAYASWEGARITELVVNHRPRTSGRSKYGLGRTFKVILDLLVMKFLFSYFGRPMHFFGTVGIASFVIGTAAEIAAVILRVTGVHLVQTPLPTVGAMFIIVGVQFVLFGLIGEVLMRTYYESRRDPSDPYAISEIVRHDAA